MSSENPQRRSTDNEPQERRQHRVDRRRGPRRTSDARVRDVLNKYRQPLIGLGLVGTAVPLVRQQDAEQDLANAPGPQTPASDPALASAARNDVEEELAERIGASKAQDERSQYVNAAVAQYDIGADLAGDIFDIAKEENIDPELAIGLVRTESTFDERAVSHVGARGLTQVMPRTARGIIPGTNADQLFDRKTNLRLGFRYLDQLVQKYRGNVKLALTAYNRGPGTVDKVLKRGGDPDNGYAGKVLGS